LTFGGNTTKSSEKEEWGLFGEQEKDTFSKSFRMAGEIKEGQVVPAFAAGTVKVILAPDQVCYLKKSNFIDQ